MPISWDATMDRKLLLAVLQAHDLSVNSQAVADVLNAEGVPCTAMAVQKRLKKIRGGTKETRKKCPDNDNDAGTNTYTKSQSVKLESSSAKSEWPDGLTEALKSETDVE